MNQYLKTIQDLLQQNKNLSEADKEALLKSIVDADKQWSITDFKLDRTEKVKKTTAILLEETIEELEQKRKAVEAQNQELEIEASLERVRAVAMGMKKPDELLSICEVLFKELKILGFGELRNALIHTFVDEQNYFNDYDYSDFAGGAITRAPYTGHPVVEKFIKEIKKAKDAFSENVVAGKELEDWKGFRTAHGQAHDPRLDGISTLYYYIYSIGPADIGISTFSAISNEKRELLKRFRNVFDLAYRRYTDIQQAEEQARESQIQLALERVRARAMAMQNSDELKELISTVFIELTKLDLALTRCVIMIYDTQSNASTWWMANSEAPADPIGLYVKYHQHPPYLAYISGWKDRKNKWQYTLEGKDKNDWDDFLFSETELSHLPDFVIAGMKAPDRVYLSVSFNNFGCLNLASLEPLSDEHFDILLRFAKVFDLTYTRFNDLQKAETQARESQIQLALERVRARTMAMQKSDELREAVLVIYEQLKLLNFESNACNIIIIDKESGSAQYWVSGFSQEIFPVSYNVPYLDHPYSEALLKPWKQGDKYLVYEYSGKMKQTFDEIFFTQTDFRNVPEEAKKMMIGLKSVMLSTAFISYGALQVIGAEPLSVENAGILQRFGKVFEQTYTRFLDLQKAEAQAQEARIEAALEKVRSRSLAVHQSEEFKDVISVVFEKLRELEIPVESASINIFIEGSKDTDVYACGHSENGLDIRKARLRYFDHPIANDLYNSHKNGFDFFVGSYGIKDKNSYYEYQFEHGDLKELPSEIKERILKTEHYSLSMAPAKHSIIIVNNFDGRLLSETEIDILKRFARVFEQAYTRFLDLQKAEAQAREAKIEAALERTRTQSMLMQHSKELDDTLRVFHEQVLLLGINSAFSFLWLPDEEKDRHIFWAAWGEGKNGSTVFKSKAINYPLDRNEPATAQCLIDWKSDEPVHSYHVPPAAVENYFAAWKELIDGVEKLKPEYFSGGLYYVEAFMKYGCFGVMVENEMAEDEKKILLRFSIEFERTYTRFLDLQKAEAQAREAQIEAALEKVRSRSLAMHQSDELEEVIMVVSEQLQQLQFRFHNASFVRYNEQKGMNFWLASPGQPQPYLIEVPFLDNPLYTRPLEAVKNGVDFIADVLTPEENHDWLDHLFEYSVLKNVSEEDKKFLRGTAGFARSLVITKHIILVIGNYAAVPYTDEQNHILKRFGHVFEQAYTRFLDLQKAEAQTREARIENALEKVRSRTMAMQRSAELAEVATVLFQQVKALGVPQWTCGFSIFEIDDKEFTWYPGSADGDILPPVKIPLTEHPVFISFNESRKKGDELFVYEKEGEFQAGHYRYMQSLPGVREMLQKMLDDGFSFPTFQIDHLAHFSHGSLVFITYEPVAEMHDVFKRFAKVFEQTYTRFLDLQKAEAQARESQIQLALERVRARTMAMQKSEELNDVAGLLFQQISELGIKAWTTGFNVWSDDNNSYTDYITSPQGNLIKAYTIDVTKFSSFRDISNAKKSGDEFWVQYLEGDQLKETYKLLAGFGGEKQYEKMLEDGFQFPSHQYDHFVFGSKVSLMFITYEPVPEAHDIFKRFGKVFEQTYTRFNDLKQAEAQALEAIKRASVDRVRAEIASMRTTADLDRITPLVWNELNILGVPFIRCGVFIMDEEKQEVQTMLSTPGGKAIATLHVPFEFDLSIIINGVEYWRKKQVYKENWDAAEFTKVWIKLSSLRETSMDSLQTEHPPESLHLHMLPFLQGMLYVGSEAPLNDEQLQLVQNLADAFSTAYARYEDFNKLEVAKKQVDNTLNELQVTQKQLIQSEKMASLGELTAGIAHEIQNPLNFVNNFSDVSHELLDEMKMELEKGNKEDAMAIAEDVKQNLEKILHHGKRADAIVKGMLQHSRTGSGQKELTDINALADEYLRLAYHGLRAKDKSFNAALHHDFDKSIDKVNIIPQDIGRVLVNLINNAFYAVNAKARKNIPGYEPALTITTKKIADNVELRVSDNGVGIPPKVVDKIFHPFFTTKPTGQGTGLGLSMAYDIITKGHGGELKVKTKEGEGSEFCIKIPVFKTPT